MPKKDDMQHSFLVVSASRQFNMVVSRSLKEYLMVDYRKSAAMARHNILERYYDHVVINSPLPDESGEQLAVDIAQTCNASVLLVVPSSDYENILESVTDFGVMVVSRPVSATVLDKAIRFLIATQNRIHSIEKQLKTAHEKMEEMRIINTAKFLLIENEHMTEDEAHRHIGKEAMNHGISRRRSAEVIIENYE